MNIHESSEDYLESILVIKERAGQVRSIDIVNELNFSKPSVSVAMKKLRENGYIEVDGGGYISLTDSGMVIAKNIYDRHKLLTKFLMHLGISSEVSAGDACKIEHDISEETYLKIKEYAEKNIPDYKE